MANNGTLTNNNYVSNDVSPVPMWDAAVHLAMHIKHLVIQNLNQSPLLHHLMASQPFTIC